MIRVGRWALLPSALLALSACAEAPAAQAGEGAIDYGYWGVEFEASASGEAQRHFINGLTAMHLYMFEDAEEEFRHARQIDPGFVMAYWGEALTHYRPIWREWQPEKGREALLRLGATPEERLAKAPTERERRYLNAVELLFAEGPPPSSSEPRESHSRLVAYERAMREIVDAYPEDLEALALWAGSRVVMFPRTERAMQERMRTASAAQEVLERNPRHPGGARYLLQSTDDPTHASMGWSAARVFMEAPDASTDATAQHMPSHTFAQLGMWREMAESNRKAFETSMAWTQSRGFRLQDLDNHNYGHLLNYAQYGYLQSGQRARAREIVERARDDYEKSGKVQEIANTLASTLALYTAETQDPTWLAELRRTAEAEGWSANANVQYTLGLVGARTGDLQLARAALQNLTAPASNVRGMIMRHQVSALVSLGEGNAARALELLREATRLEAAQMYSHFGPPTPSKPAHELYGEVLLGLNRHEEALEAFETSLWIFSRRPASLLGAGRAAAALGRTEIATRYHAEVAEIWREGDPDLPELGAVRARGE
jgi:tetratricopeptide (TPR) repeat protein